MTETLPDGSWSVFGLPRSHWHCQFENFDWELTRPRAIRREIVTFTQSARDREAPHLIFTGTPGIGKSHLGVALYRWGVMEWGTIESTWINVPDFCARVKASYDGGVVDPFDAYREARKLVVLDDLFGKDLSPHERSQIIPRLIDIPYMNSAAMVFTMNPNHEEMQELLSGHEVSRILSNSTVIPVTSSQDQRLPQ